jgi:hypothetical protein
MVILNLFASRREAADAAQRCMLKSSVTIERAVLHQRVLPAPSGCDAVVLRAIRFTTLAAADNFARSPIIEITKEQLIAMAKAISLEIAETDVENVRVRLSALLTEMESVERDLGPEMDKVEPVPPVYPREEF